MTGGVEVDAVPWETLSPIERRHRLRELAGVFLKLGTVGFGGPAAHMAMMEDEVVARRGWIPRERFLDLLAAAHLIPGPNSTELAIHVGHARAGWRGLLVAGGCFILPAVLIVWSLAALYVRYQALPELGWILYGVKPVVLAVVAQAVWRLGRSALRGVPSALAAGGAAALYFLGVNELLILAAGGLAVLALARFRAPGPGIASSFAAPAALLAQGPLFLFFVKVGSVLYGSGYVLLAFLQGDLVDRWGWLTSEQLLDAVAVGQVTPGPLFTTATFVGYVVGGNPGALAATIGIFLPAFLFVALLTPWIPRLRASPRFSSALDGVTAASLGLMAAVSVDLASAAFVDPWTVALAVAAAVAVIRFRVNAAWVVLAGAAAGLALHLAV